MGLAVGNAAGIVRRPAAARLLLAALFLMLAMFAAVAEERRLTVVSDDNYPPYIFRDARGELKGFLVDLWALFGERNGVRVDLQAMDWARAQETMRQGRAQVIDTIFRTPEREAIYDFAPPYADIPVPIYVHRDIGGIMDLGTLQGFLVGVKAGDACIGRLEQAGVGTLKAYDSYERLVEGVLAGQVRVFCLDEPPANYLLYRAGAHREFRRAFTLYAGQFHRAVKKGDAATLGLLESGFARISPAEVRALEDKWLGTPITINPWVNYAIYGLGMALGTGALMAVWVLALRREVKRRTAETEREKGFLRTLVDTLPDLVWLKDPDGIYLACNREFELFFGAREADILGRTDYDFVPRELADFFRGKDREAIAAGGPRSNEEEIVYASDGHHALLETIKTPMFDRSGQLIGVLGIGRDITARKAAEQEARDTQERFAVAFRASPVAASLARVRDGYFMDVNDKYLRDFGWARDEIVGRTSIDIGLWPDPDLRRQWVTELRRQGTLIDYETEWNDRWQQRRLVSISAEIVSLQGEPFILAYTVDITQRKAAEAALRESEARYHSLYDGMLDGYARVDREGRVVESNAAFRAMLGYSEEELAAMTYRELTPPVWHAAEEAILAEDILATGHSRLYEKEYRRRDGTTVPVELRTYLIRDEAGAPAGMWAIVRDISERHRNEGMLRLAARVFDSTAEGITFTDPQGNIIAVNKAFTAITGYSEAEVLGKNPRLLASGRHEPEFYKAMWDAIVEHGLWQGELWNRRKNGTIYPEWLTISAVRDSEGRTTHYVAVFSDISVVKESQEALRFIAHHDALTQLPNRILLRDRLEHALQRARRDQEKVAVLFVDLDRFKHINDTLGHPAGDEVLRQAARTMALQLRGSDTIARVGGDEFVVLLEHEVGTHSVATVARKLVETFARPFKAEGRELYVTASIGISVYPADGDDPDTLLKHADIAMYRAKEQGRNNYQFYEAAMGAGALERLIVENALRGAVNRGEFLLHYQPQVSLADASLAGVEALLRWHHPELGVVPPGQFIPVAEEMGIIGEVGDWVLREACRQTAAWRAEGFTVPRLSVNLSVQQLEQEALLEHVERLLADAGLNPWQLELEVTESVLMRQTGRAMEILEGLRKLGVFLAVDDFGTGYSSLAYLKQMPVHRLKIDSSFVRDIGRDPNDEAIARAVIALGHSLALDVVAEGVERQDQADFLSAAGCDVAQGYLYARPLPPGELVARWGARTPGGRQGA